MIGSLLESIFESPSTTLTTIILVGSVVVLVQRLLGTNVENLPPCPSYKLPVLGHLHVLGADLSKPFRRFRKEVGDVYRIYLGSRLCVVISGFDAIKDAIVTNGDSFNHRPYFPAISRLSRGEGVVWANGEKWQEHRRFTLMTLKDFGMGKSKLECDIHEEIRLLFDAIEAERGRPFNPRLHIQTHIANVICFMLFGSTFKHGDNTFKTLIKDVSEMFEAGFVAVLLDIMPVLKWLPGDLFGEKNVEKNLGKVFRFINDIIEGQKEAQNEGNVSDYVGAYVEKIISLEKSGTSTTFNPHELATTVVELFLAGVETTTTTMMWSLPLLASHSEIQNRMFEEIQTHVGTERLPSIKDKTNLVYVEAFYMEVLRYTNLATGVPRAVANDVHFRGYRIPADTIIFLDTGSVMFDPAIWTDPEVFRPSRFIDESGRLRKMEEFISFSLGKRNCVGESLARMELLLFLSAIVQRYELVCPDGVDLSMDTIDGEFNTVHSPKPYDIICRRR